MTYYKKFNDSIYCPTGELADWLAKNDVKIVAVKDGLMYGNLRVYYTSPSLTGGKVCVGKGYSSLHGSHSCEFSSDDKMSA